VVGAAADQHRLPKLDEAVRDGDTVRLGKATARVIDTPGHTRGQINFFFSDGDVLLSGDTLFSLGCGRLFSGTADETFASLHKLHALRPATLICCGHECTLSNSRFALAVDPDVVTCTLAPRYEAVRTARDFARSTQAAEMFLETAKDNTIAQAAYEALGWQRETVFFKYNLPLDEA